MWPVVDDDGKLEYWDVHDPEDPHGEGDPVEEGFGTMVEAKRFIRKRVKDDAFLRGVELATFRMGGQ